MNNDLFFGNDFDADSDEPINFLENRFNDLSPFSAHEVEIDGIVYKTAEHAYQALRVLPEDRALIMNARSPLDAWRAGQRCKEAGRLVDNFDKDALMEKIFRAKLAQHPDIALVLKASGERDLLKVYSADAYWGTGPDGRGENRMGKLWMKLRSEFF
ncbi:MAG TPA: NADAR family protein [Candidatus Paceibacterota bacterium]